MMKTFRKACLAIAVITLVVAGLTACNSNTLKLLDGRWQLSQSGNSKGENMRDPDLPVYVDIYKNGRVTMYGLDLGSFKMRRNTFSFKSDDGKYEYSGSFVLDYPDLYLYLDGADECHYFVKTHEHNLDGSIKTAG